MNEGEKMKLRFEGKTISLREWKLWVLGVIIGTLFGLILSSFHVR
jgi:hypothetical protein